MSNPMPNRPQTRIRLTVLGAKPRYGSTSGATMSASAVMTSTRQERGLCESRTRLLAASGTKKAMWTHHQHQRHRGEQHDVGVTRVDHRSEADDLAGDQAAKHCPGK